MKLTNNDVILHQQQSKQIQLYEKGNHFCPGKLLFTHLNLYSNRTFDLFFYKIITDGHKPGYYSKDIDPGLSTNFQLCKYRRSFWKNGRVLEAGETRQAFCRSWD
jgi:hypothetical protein